MEVSNELNEIYTRNEINDITMHEIIIRKEFDSYCPYYIDEDFVSKPLTDVEVKNSDSVNKKSTIIENLDFNKKSIDVFKNYEQENKNKNVVNIDEYILKDLCDKNLYRNLLCTKNVSYHQYIFIL